jgi:hypothetical protein
MDNRTKAAALVDTFMLFKKWEEDGDDVKELQIGLNFYFTQFSSMVDFAALLEMEVV